MEKIVVIDNYDSFTYNLVYSVQEITGKRPAVYRNDKVDFEVLNACEGIILSPGPGIPEEAGMLKALIRRYAPAKSILGVCLGHQAIAEVFGATLINTERVFHGVSTWINLSDQDDYIFRNLPEKIQGGRYHSWLVSARTLPDCLKVTANAEDGEIMAVRHQELDIRGLQFHPESILTKQGNEIIYNWINH